MCAPWHHCRTFKSCDYVVGPSVLADKLAYTHIHMISSLYPLLPQLHSLIPTNLRASPHRKLLMLALCPCSLTQTFTKTNGLVPKLDIQMCKYVDMNMSHIPLIHICNMPLISIPIYYLSHTLISVHYHSYLSHTPS